MSYCLPMPSNCGVRSIVIFNNFPLKIRAVDSIFIVYEQNASITSLKTLLQICAQILIMNTRMLLFAALNLALVAEIR